MKIKSILLTIFLLGFGSLLSGQGRFDKIQIQTTQVSPSIFMLKGSGGNIGVLTGSDGTIMIDDQYAPLYWKIKTAIRKITDDPVKYIINTHWHGDHTGGNAEFGKEGVVIVAHENVRNRMSTDQFNKAFNRTTKASPEIAWPVVTFTSDLKLHLNGEDVAILHIEHAHTDGDAFVYFSSSNVLHMGDTFFNQRFPYIDLGSGGSVKGLISAVDKALMLVDDETKIIPGHGDLATKSDLRSYRDVIASVFEDVKNAVDAGKTLEEIKSAGFTSEFEGWGSGFISDERFLDIIWTDLNRK